MSDVVVSASGLSKRFWLVSSQGTILRAAQALLRGESLRREHWVLRDLSFTIRRGEKLALIGRNGSGKTTLLRLMAEIVEPTAGSLAVAERPTALFNASTGFIHELSVVDNLYLFGAIYEIGRDILAPRERAVLEMAELEHLKFSPLKDLSTGQIQRLALSIFAQTPSQFLIFDEVLANVDSAFARKIDGYFRALAESDRTVVMTSHDASFLRRYCARGFWLDQGALRHAGPLDDVLAAYEHAIELGAAAPTPAGALAALGAPRP